MPNNANYKYGIEYKRIVDMAILTPGPVNGYEVTPETIDEVASSYDPINVLQAPIVLDHIMQGPAYGHVLKLWVDDQGGGESNVKLMAKVGLLIDGAAAISSGQFPERSVFMLNFFPLDGVWYLNHLALLGAANPAVIGLDLVELADLTEDEMTRAGFTEIDKNKARICAERVHTWKKGDKFIEFRLRPAYRFESLQERPIHRYKGIHARAGKLKAHYIADGDSPDKVINQALLFEANKWDIPTAKQWLGTQRFGFDVMLVPERIAAALDIKGVDNVNEQPLLFDGKIKAVWEETDEYIRHRVRPPEDFLPDEFKTVDISAEQGIVSIMGKLKPENVPEGNDADSMVVQNVMFDKTKDWDMEKAKKWVADHPDFKASHDAKNTNLAANAEGGLRMPDEKIEKPVTPPAELHTVEAGSIPDLVRDNAELQAAKEKNDATALKYQTDLNIELRKKNEESRAIIIKAKVGSLVQVGYITPAQIKMGLIEALSFIPDKAVVVVGEDETPALDIVLECLKYGGMLKLKDEIPIPKKERKVSSNPDLDILGKSGARVNNIGVAERARELRATGKSAVEALQMATIEAGGNKS
jgi:hypothetical protein